MKKIIVMFVAFSFLVTCGLGPDADVFAGDLPSASSTDPATGITTTVEEDAKGGRTKTVTDREGNVISKRHKPPPGYARPKRRGGWKVSKTQTCCSTRFFGPDPEARKAKKRKLEKAREAAKKRKEAAKKAVREARKKAAEAKAKRKAERKRRYKRHIEREHHD
ncbi:MAG: hypothetical protein ACE5JK_03930 [Candidatus Omnitrophota bacterium]